MPSTTVLYVATDCLETRISCLRRVHNYS